MLRFSRAGQGMIKRLHFLLMLLKQTLPPHLTCTRRVWTQPGTHTHTQSQLYVHVQVCTLLGNYFVLFNNTNVFVCIIILLCVWEEAVTFLCLFSLVHALIGYPLRSGWGLYPKTCPIIRKWVWTHKWFLLFVLFSSIGLRVTDCHFPLLFVVFIMWLITDGVFSFVLI